MPPVIIIHVIFIIVNHYYHFLVNNLLLYVTVHVTKDAKEDSTLPSTSQCENPQESEGRDNV